VSRIFGNPSLSAANLGSADATTLREAIWIRLVAFAIALLLLATAAAKAHSPREAVALEAAYRIPLWLSAVVVQVDLILACLLLFAVSLRRTLAAVALLFCGFAVFSAYRAWAGDESCGCFGVVKVHPLHTLIFDVVVAAMASTASRCAPVSEQAANMVRAVSVYALLGLAVEVWMAGRSPIIATDGSRVLPTAGLVLLEPESWHGKPIPVGDHLTPRIGSTSISRASMRSTRSRRASRSRGPGWAAPIPQPSCSRSSTEAADQWAKMRSWKCWRPW
jgi:hypothetical protein